MARKPRIFTTTGEGYGRHKSERIRKANIVMAKSSTARANRAEEMLGGVGGSSNPWFIVSGQKMWTSDDLRVVNDMLVHDYIQTVGRAVLNASIRVYEFFQILTPSIAFKTGRLRAVYTESFENAKFIFQQLDRSIKASRKSVKTFEINLGFIKILEAIDYAKYHITEFSGARSYANPTTGGTFPLSLNDIVLSIGGIVEEMIPRQFLSEGWDLNTLSDIEKGVFNNLDLSSNPVPVPSVRSV